MIPKIRICISENYVHDSTVIYERQQNFSMNIEVDAEGVDDFIILKFDQNRSTLFPYFVRENGLGRICDYVVIFQRSNSIKVVSIELKRTKSNDSNAICNLQLRATECFLSYIIQSLKRIDDSLDVRNVSYINLKIFDTRLKSKLRKNIKKDLANPLTNCIENIYEYKGEKLRLNTL